jgi:hypothetical protein
MYYRHEILGEKRAREESARIAHPLCKERRLYRVDTRNFGPVAVFDGKTGFIGLRRKFDTIRLDTEYHYDPGADGTGCFGTANPWQELEDSLPDDIELRESMPDICRDCGVRVEYSRAIYEANIANGNGRALDPGYVSPWSHLGATECKKANPVGVQNQLLFDWLMKMEEKHLGPPGWKPEWLDPTWHPRKNR